MNNQVSIEAEEFVRIGDAVYYVVDPDLDEQTALLVPVEMLKITEDYNSLKQKAQPFQKK